MERGRCIGGIKHKTAILGDLVVQDWRFGFGWIGDIRFFQSENC